MKQIKGILKANLANNPLDTIYWGNPSIRTFQDALLVYQSSNMAGKTQIQQRAYRKLSKPKPHQVIMSTLYFLDIIMHSGYMINLPNKNLQIDFDNSQVSQSVSADRIKTAITSFVSLYMKILVRQSNKPQRMGSLSLEDSMKYCQIVIANVMELIQSDYVVHFALVHIGQCKSIYFLAAKSIIERIADDLQILNHFVKDNIKLILSENQFSFRINDIYEKTLFISKNSEKLMGVRRKAQSPCQLNFYAFDSQTNKKIQKQILGRDAQRRQFISEKNIKSKNQGYNNQEFGSCPDIMSEESMLLCDN